MSTSPFPISSSPHTFFPKRTKGYCFGFQRQEQDDELWEGSVTFKYRVEDPRLGRFFSVDPLFAKYSYNSTYAFSENSTIAFRELEGLEKYYTCLGEFLGLVGNSPEIRVVNESYSAAIVKTYIKKAGQIEEIGAEQAYQIKENLKANSTELFQFLKPVDDVLNDAPLETYAEHHDCKTSCDKQLEKAGFTSEGPYEAIQTEKKRDNKEKLDDENRIGALIYIGYALKSGMPVELGVKGVFPSGTEASVGNKNELTTHFVVAVGLSFEGGNINVRIYDNGTRDYGKDPNRKLTFDYSTMLLKSVNDQGFGMQVTEVRRTNK